jgi:transposase-like protein
MSGKFCLNNREKLINSPPQYFTLQSIKPVRQLNKVQLGMSQRDIEDTLKQIYGTEISQGLVSRITDKILPEANEWQNRPLEAVYPVVFFDGIVFNSRKDNKIITKCVYSVLGINMDGHKEILGTWSLSAGRYQ